MIIGRRYTDSNNLRKKFKVMKSYTSGNSTGFIVNMIRDGKKIKEAIFVPDSYNVEPLMWGKKRINKEQMDKIIKHIKGGDWHKEKKSYIIFRIHDIHHTLYKLYYIAQKVLVREWIDKIKPEKQYKNGYYVYSLSDIQKYILSSKI